MFFWRFFLIPYLVTILVEMILSILWGYRTRRDLLTIFLVNTLTNPLVSALRYLSGQMVPSAALRTVILIVLEIAVLLSEWKLFQKFLSKGSRSGLFLFAFVINAASFGAGFLVPLWFQLFKTR